MNKQRKFPKEALKFEFETLKLSAQKVNNNKLFTP